MSRDFHSVAQKILEIIPESEGDFRASIEYAKDLSIYTPPESMRRCWALGQEAIQRHIPKPPAQLNDWQRRAVDLWMAKS